MRRPLAIAVLLGVLGASAGASAEKTRREGWLLGFAIGAAGLKYKHVDFQDDAHGGGSFQLTFGGMLKPRIALLAHLELVLTGGSEGRTHNLFAATVAARWFALDMLWLQGGLGTGGYSASATQSGEGVPSYSISGGRTLALAAGVDVLQTGSFGLSAELHTTITDFTDEGVITYSLVLGLTWY